MSLYRHDIVIAGGGLAGLAFAWSLRQHAPHLSVKVVETRSAYGQDRHWGFWWPIHMPFSFEESVTTRLSAWRVASQTEETIVTARRYSYCIIRSADWYDKVLAQLTDIVVTDAPCTAVTPEAVTTPTDTYEGRMVVNAMPPDTSSASLFQAFRGFVVETQQPVFDPQTLTLMDFTLNQPPQGCGFLYVIPFSAHSALIEPTVLTASLPGDDWYGQSLEAFMQPRAGTGWHIRDEEAGCLPLDGLPCPQSAPVYPIGTRAGWMRPSTGYAFIRSLRLADNLARYIARHDALPPRIPYAYRWLARRMDRCFVRLIRDNPQALPAIFTHWFSRLDADRFVAFLQDEGSPLDALSVITHARDKRRFLNAMAGR